MHILTVIPEVNAVASSTLVTLGDTVTINCSVVRANPSDTTLEIFHVETSTNVSTERLYTLSNIQDANLGTYHCNVTNDAGTGSASVTIEQGGNVGWILFNLPT